jgi:hypothetical protein
MEIKLLEPLIVEGMIQDLVTLTEQLPTGHTQELTASIWISSDAPSGKPLRDARIATTIALLERALQALKSA